MIGLLQRVSHASVAVNGACVARIERGLLVFIGVQRHDDHARAARLLERLLGYRVFEDEQGRMNRSLRDLGPDAAGLLLVPQFTLAADTSSGSRPGFSTAAGPEDARVIYERLAVSASASWPGSGSGIFGADMQVSLVNDGPVTFLLTA